MMLCAVSSPCLWAEVEAARLRSAMWLQTFLMAVVCMKFTSSLDKMGVDYVMQIEHEMERKDIENFVPPPLALMEAALAPQEMILQSVPTGLQNVPTDYPCLFVMNHSLLGVEMAPFLKLLYKEKGFLVRSLADHMHFASPHGALLRQFGGVDGTRENVGALMSSKQNILVYPGGGHEIMKHSSVEKYTLMWKERLGFARMAIKHGYPIVPCCAVGTEDMLRIVADIPLHFVRKGASLPICTTSPSKLQKIYFWFGEPIHTSKYNGEHQNDAYARELRDEVKAAIEAGIREMQAKQEEDPDRYLLDQMASKVAEIQDTMWKSIASIYSGGAVTKKEE
jgi:1-acyl-sn-glycerol-3-phosphate acyltransferase